MELDPFVKTWPGSTAAVHEKVHDFDFDSKCADSVDCFPKAIPESLPP